MATSDRSLSSYRETLPEPDSALVKIVRYTLLAAMLGCGDRGATIWARAESGFIPSGSIRIEPVGLGLKRPVYATAPSGDPRLFRAGEIDAPIATALK